jgi:predicted regulator of Ras-like GTPase activity (Roadblock/LC7/MglB family)
MEKLVMSPRKKPSPTDIQEHNNQALNVEEKSEAENIRATLDKIRSREGIIGYIIRSPTSASVDVNDPGQIIDYAALTAGAQESSESLSEIFELGKINNIVTESKTLKILSLTKGEHLVSVFMEKNVDPHSIYREIE